MDALISYIPVQCPVSASGERTTSALINAIINTAARGIIYTTNAVHQKPRIDLLLFVSNAILQIA